MAIDSCPNCGNDDLVDVGAEGGIVSCSACNLAVDPGAEEDSLVVNPVAGHAEVDEFGHYERPEDSIEHRPDLVALNEHLREAYPENETVVAEPGEAPVQPLDEVVEVEPAPEGARPGHELREERLDEEGIIEPDVK
jgi:hypothetical protein